MALSLCSFPYTPVFAAEDDMILTEAAAIKPENEDEVREAFSVEQKTCEATANAAKGNDVKYGWYFEEEPTDWTFIDADGDGYNWNHTNHAGVGVQAYEGECSIYSISYSNDNVEALAPDNWAISPAFSLEDLTCATLSVWACEWFFHLSDTFALYAGTSADPLEMTKLTDDIATTATFGNYTADLSSFIGEPEVYIAIRHYNSYNQFALDVDCVEVKEIAFCDHELEKVPAFSGSCTENGHNAYYICNRCGQTFTDGKGIHPVSLEKILFPIKHAWKEVVPDNNGHHTKKCEICGTEETEECSYDTVIDNKVTKYTCTECGFSYNEIYHGICTHYGWYFEEEPTDWTFVDADGDGYNWNHYIFKDESIDAYEGHGVIYSCSYIKDIQEPLTPDNWAVSPAFSLKDIPEATLSVWAREWDYGYPDTFALYAGTSADPHEMTKLTDDIVSTSSFVNYTADLSSFAGEQEVYIAIRHYNSDDQFVLDVDCVEIRGMNNPCDSHVLTPVPALEPTCEKVGNTAYYRCEKCGTFFLDADGTQPVQPGDVITPMTDLHDLTRVPAVQPGFGTAGNIEYWRCELCGKYFSDGNGENEIGEKDIFIPATGSEWMELQTLIDDTKDGGTLKLEKGYTADPGDPALVIPEGRSMTIDLGGYVIDRGLADGEAVENGNVITNNGTLTITDTGGQTGAITGGNNEGSGGGIVNNGVLTLEGGAVSGNKTAGSGGGICNFGSLTMTGGSISGNASGAWGGGIYMPNADNVSGALTGGSISENTCVNNGGGIHVSEHAVLTISGSPAVSGNSKRGAANNLNLAGDAVIRLVGGLTEGADLWVSKSAGTGVVTSGYSTYNREIPPTWFHSDNAEYDVLLSAGEAEIDKGVDVSYVERAWDGSGVTETTKSTLGNARVFPQSRTIAGGWYYVDRDITIKSRVSLEGDTWLILGDGKELDVKGLYVPKGSTLTIYARSDGEEAGKIYSHPSGGAAIGGNSGHDNGNIIIHGGTIEANGYDHCAGIGSNDGKTGGDITIYGGTITAKGGSDGAGIGGGRDCDGGTITIYGGNITANGPTGSDCCENGAGIGGGDCGSGGKIAIYGGTITTYSRDGAGIGGGDDGDGGTITIHGGTITSEKVNQGQGARIGGGCDAAPGTITIDGGSITTIGGSGAGIGGGKGNTAGGSVTVTGGVINASGVTDEGDSYGIGSGEDGSDVAVTLGWMDVTRETISITASSFNGPVTLKKPFAMYSAGRLIPAGAVSDNSLLSGGALTALSGRVSTWEQLRMALEYGGLIVVTGDITASENDSELYGPSGVTAELDLQGYSVNASALGSQEDVCSYCMAILGSFTLSDTVGGGRFYGGDNGFTDIILMEYGSAFTMNGGTVTGYGTELEDVVYVNENSIFIMNGGAITADLGNGESTLGHIYVTDNGSFTMNDGTVSGSGGKADVMTCGGRFQLNGGSLACSGQEYGNVYVASRHGVSGRFAVAGSPRLTAGVYLTGGYTITVGGPLGEGVIIPVMTKAEPTDIDPLIITNGLPGNGTAENFVSGDPKYLVGLNEDGEAVLGIPVTVTFAPGYETSETMESKTWAIGGWYPLPACEFTGPAGKTFTGWLAGEDTGPTGAGELVSVKWDITLTAAWADLPHVTINGVSGSFNDRIKLNFYFDIPDAVLEDEAAYVTLTNEDTGKEITMLVGDAEFVDGKGYKFSILLAAKEAGDTITARVFDGEGNALPITGNLRGNDYTESGVQYSLMQYFEWLKDSGTTDKEKAVGAAAKDYCAAAQIYFGYNSDGVSVSSAVDAVTSDALSGFVAGRSGTLPSGVSIKGISAMLESDNTLRLYLGFKDGNTSGYTFAIDGKETDVRQRRDGSYYLALDTGVYSNHLQDTHTYTVSDGTNTYTITASVMTYARSCAIKEDEKVSNLGKTLYLYNQAAVAAFGG